MATGNEGDGVLRRMVKLVAQPARELIGSGAADSRASQFADAEKAELKAMIERKRRNDFVRKRELNMLRRIRREGLTPEQAAGLEASSALDDSDVRATQPPGPGDSGVKAKIDAIERQMVGGSPYATPAGARAAAAQPPAKRVAPPSRPGLLAAVSRRVGLATGDAATVPADMNSEAFDEGTRPMLMMPRDAASPRGTATVPPTLTDPVPVTLAQALPAPPPPLASVEVSEAVHDHELDEAVIAFANADFIHSERALVNLVAPQGARHPHQETWLTLFDLYRATGQQPRFEALATEYRQCFQTSPPQWYSLPRLVAEATSSGVGRATQGSEVGWICPARLDAEAVTGLVSQTLQLPLPWVLDWTALQDIEADAVNQLRNQLRQWAGQALEMRWLASDRLFAVLQDSAPVGVRDADPGYWLARLEALRLINRPDQFDEAAIDYCVTYEVSPPSWEPTRCVARVGGSAANTRAAALSVIGEATTTVHGSGADTVGLTITSLELSGQLSGDISPVLGALDGKLGGAPLVRINCALLIRVDFIAAGDLLNWIIARQGEGRHISFVDVHRLVALMFGAMGITEHAPVHLRQA